jgi:class 3 adenylate cyclase/TolB-like protein
MERKLVAIFAADVVGYARLMERDEAGTFARLRAGRKELFEPEIERHHGRIFKLMGDGLLAEFGSVVDAVECSVVLQREMAERNNGLPEDQRIDVRVGVHLGDVILEGDDRHGDAVNIAARLQQLAEPGGICVSDTVAKHVDRKVAVAFESIGKHKVKNIAEPVAVSRVVMEAAPTRGRHGRHLRAWCAAAALVLLIAGGVGAAWYLRTSAEPTDVAALQPQAAPAPAASANPAPASSTSRTDTVATAAPPSESQPAAPSDEGIPVIVVLPFEDLTGDQVHNELGRGVAEAFITDLSTFPEYDVVSSTTSFRLSDKTVPEIVKATGALFVVEGSIRRSGDKALVTVQLIRGSTDRHLRIAQIEEKMTDPVAMQEAVAGRIRDELGGMTGVLRKESEKIALAKTDAEFTEYDYYILGHIYTFQDQWERAREIWEKGLKRFPNSILLRCKMTLYHLYYKRSPNAAAPLVAEVAPLPKTTRLDEWYYHWVTAELHSFRGEMDQAVAEAKLVIAMAPYDAISLSNMAWIFSDGGLHDEAIKLASFSLANDPHPLKWQFASFVYAYENAGRIQEAVDIAETEIHNSPSPSKYWYEVLGKGYSALGQNDKSKAAYKKFLSLPNPPTQ